MKQKEAKRLFQDITGSIDGIVNLTQPSKGGCAVVIDILAGLTCVQAFEVLLALLRFLSTLPGAIADCAFVMMVARVDKELTTFSFKLATLYFPVSPLCDHPCFCLNVWRPFGDCITPLLPSMRTHPVSDREAHAA